MNNGRILQEIIAAHRAALLVDEASFTDDGLAISEELAERTGAAERAAYAEFVRAPCHSAVEVQVKVAYLLNGSVGVRDTLLDCLVDYGADFEGGLLEPFLRSLVVDPLRTCACACTREEEA